MMDLNVTGCGLNLTGSDQDPVVGSLMLSGNEHMGSITGP
jgi:hypothetical protein